MSVEQRTLFLRQLLSGELPPKEAAANLRRFQWDSDDELVTLKPEHVRQVLERYLFGELSAEWLEAWADTIECRDDIGYPSEHEDVLLQVIADLANPEVNGTMNRERAAEMLGTLP